MTKLYLGTHFVKLDEPCLQLREDVRLTPDYKELHRYQTLTIIRSDSPTECCKDLGEQSNFRVDPFLISGSGKVGDINYTVGQMLDMADSLRNNPPWQPESVINMDKGKPLNIPDYRRKI